MDFAIIAAGQGSRLSREGADAPKPLVPIGGRPMLGRLLEVMALCGARRVTVAINDFMPQVRSYLAEARLPVEVDVRVRTTPSSMHTFAVATEGFDGRFCVTTVDTVFAPEALQGLLRAFEAHPEADGMMGVTTLVDDEKPLWVTTGPDGLIRAYTDERPDAAAVAGRAVSVSAGVYALGPRALLTLRRCLESGVSRMRGFQRAMLADGLSLRAYDMGRVIDVDHAADLEAARELDAASPLPGNFSNPTTTHTITHGRD